jgi:hypothetical protein
LDNFQGENYKKKELGRYLLHVFYLWNPCSTGKGKKKAKKGKKKREEHQRKKEKRL